MNLNDKNNCIDNLVTGLMSSSLWRLRKDESYPGDERNLIAAASLHRLADEARTLSDADWEALEPHFSWASEKWMSAMSLTARQVGFSRHPRDITAFVSQLVMGLSRVAA